MIVLEVRNVNEALYQGMEVMQELGVERGSRGGVVKEVPTPVATIYKQPEERVLFSPARDANPFFHLFEAMWMLAGREDLAFLRHFNKRIEQYSDDGIVFHGAYGFRWREWFGHDQLEDIIATLRKDPDTRRALLTMWDPEKDQPLKAGKDLPCNTHVYFKVRFGRLDMTVSNRSNDMLWGAYGANAVHMSILQEYVANRAGLKLGRYVQLSDSFHVYLSGAGGEVWGRMLERGPTWDRLALARGTLWEDPYHDGTVQHFPLGAEDAAWDLDMYRFFKAWDQWEDPGVEVYLTPWWRDVIMPLWRGWEKRDRALTAQCAATDWRRACDEWLARRGR